MRPTPTRAAALLLCLLFLLPTLFPPTARSGERQMSEEAELFQQLRDGVFTVYSEYGKGSGFLVDERGLVVTNSHVLSTSDHVRVLLEPGRKVAARIVVQDKSRDLAVLLIHPSFTEGLPVLALSEAGEDFVMVGERVLAIGSPLHQERVLTTGIVSKVEEKAILADVNINAGNSGGPLLNLAGEVVGVNTFGDVAERGQGLAGSIRVDLLLPVLDKAEERLASVDAPEKRLYPCLPDDTFPSYSLMQAARVEDWPHDDYVVDVKASPRTQRRRFKTESGASVDGFLVELMTPPRLYNIVKAREMRLEKKAAERSEEAADDFDTFDDLVEWGQHAGGWSPTVLFIVQPKVGQTTGSKVGGFLSAIAAGATGVYGGSHVSLEFKADLAHFDLYEGGEPVDDLQRGIQWVPMDFYVSSGLSSASGEDLARMGVFHYPAEAFLADESGHWPELEVHLSSSEDDAEMQVIPLHRRYLERVAVDFDSYLWQQRCRDAELLVGGTR